MELCRDVIASITHFLLCFALSSQCLHGVINEFQSSDPAQKKKRPFRGVGPTVLASGGGHASQYSYEEVICQVNYKILKNAKILLQRGVRFVSSLLN